MTRKLILIKHASPQVVEGVPSEQWTLSDSGRSRCAELADAIARWRPARLISSEEPKAAETAQLVATRLGVPVGLDSHLAEHDRSNVPMMRSAEFISSMALFFKRPRELVLGRETARAVELRITNAIEAALADHADENLGIVSHGASLAAFIAAKKKQDPFQLWRQMGLPSFAVFELPEWTLLEMVPRL